MDTTPAPRNPIAILTLRDGRYDRTVAIFEPDRSLWECLGSLLGSPDPTPIRILEAVAAHCSDATFEGHPEFLVRLTCAILSTWDARYVPVAVSKGAVLEALETWWLGIRKVNAYLSLRLDPHPELHERAVGIGRDFARARMRQPLARVAEPTPDRDGGRATGERNGVPDGLPRPPVMAGRIAGEEPKRRRARRGAAEELIIGALQALDSEGRWDATEEEIRRISGVKKSTYYYTIKYSNRVVLAMDSFRGRRLGKGPLRPDDL
jgi:hypothetical protein